MLGRRCELLPSVHGLSRNLHANAYEFHPRSPRSLPNVRDLYPRPHS